ncbi:MAG: hypothetical protein HZA32_11970 [Opitutae bacterium]|nr:hypothetical protein [Opitutae bacterium]
MSPALFEADLLERRRRAAWRRLARPDESVAPARDVDAVEPYSLGYPRRSPLLRALVPIALAFLLFIAYGPSRSGSSAPRTAELELIR